MMGGDRMEKFFHERKSYFLCLVWAVLFFVIYIFCNTGPLFFLRYGLHVSVDDLIYALVSDILLSVLLFFLYRKYRKLLKKEGKPFRPMPWFWFLFVALVILEWYFSQMLATYVHHYVADSNYDAYAAIVAKNPQLYVVIAIVLAPICEELFFRGILYSFLQTSFHPLIAGLLSAAFFALSHGTVVHLAVAFTFGFFLAFLYDFTGHLRYCILAHMFSNLLSFGVLLQVPSTLIVLPVFLLVLCGLILGIVFLWRQKDLLYGYVTTPHLIDEWNKKDLK